jgi:mannose-6-phosphate isomerase-like protein (cupin superfamily)
MRKARLIAAIALITCSAALVSTQGPAGSARTLTGVKTKAELDALVAKIRAGELTGPQMLFDEDKGGYQIYTSFVQKRKGAADIHGIDDEVFLILSGSATATLGGDVVDKKATGENEYRGTTIAGGTAHAVAAGDLVSVPHGTAHQMDSGTGEVLYLVIKIKGRR